MGKLPLCGLTDPARHGFFCFSTERKTETLPEGRSFLVGAAELLLLLAAPAICPMNCIAAPRARFPPRLSLKTLDKNKNSERMGVWDARYERGPFITLETSQCLNDFKKINSEVLNELYCAVLVRLFSGRCVLFQS